ncbi:hypothetical protein AGE07_23895 [Salmonella enterica subsp. enterica serovar Kentucky]|nr:hypothetical protein AGE07_23895 [Salmonella enterica subsp. enterica serovar Kentucky]
MGDGSGDGTIPAEITQIGEERVTAVKHMLNGSHSFLAYLGYLGGYGTIAASITHPAYPRGGPGVMLD